MIHILRFFHSSTTPTFRCGISASVVSIANILLFQGLINTSKAPLILLPAAIRLCVFSSFLSNARTLSGLSLREDFPWKGNFPLAYHFVSLHAAKLRWLIRKMCIFLLAHRLSDLFKQILQQGKRLKNYI